MRIICILGAYVLDLIFGDPPSLPHPVRVIGWLITRLETVFRRVIANERLGGTIFAFTVIAIVWGATFAITITAYLFNDYIGIAVSMIIIYTSISVKDLGVESLAVFRALKDGDLDKARAELSKIVGRDTANLDEREIVRAAVETVAENTVDGIISPLFYAFLGGAPAAMAYKAVNTLDSMVGYKNKRYINFGWASAKIDDIANYIPARLAVLFMVPATWMIGRDPINAWKITMRDGRKNPSPNSGLTEAAVAGALGIRLGGLNYYHSIASEKPFIGDDANPLVKTHIKDAVRIAYVTSAIFICTASLLVWLLNKGGAV